MFSGGRISKCYYSSSLSFFLAKFLSISSLQVELESVKNQYAIAQLECNAADERAKILASEVIGLEEKVINFVDAWSFNDN